MSSKNPKKKRSYSACPHDVYVRGLCGRCGAKIDTPQSTSVSMIHSVPELKVSEELAKSIGKDDQDRLIQERKLVLLIDLDQTILHTTHENIADDPNVKSFNLWPGHPTYHTKLRPYLEEFLERMSKIYELHIFTFGCRSYAHKIAEIIDPDKKYFSNRILSRDESADQQYKEGNLNNLFPCGDAMVCIIDDRTDVWRNAGNLIHVSAYTYFKTSISDGASRNPVVEDDKSLEEDVDKLEALLGLSDKDDDDDDDGDTKEPPQSSSSASSSSSGDDEEGTSEKETISPIEDTDQYLRYLPTILERIHDKWYMELDEQRRFLAEGESYKLPEVKDIIRKYLRIRPGFNPDEMKRKLDEMEKR